MDYMPHIKFEKEERFGVHHEEREGGASHGDLYLLKYDGDKWIKIEEETQKEAFGSQGKLRDEQLKTWGEEKAEFYV